MVQIRRQYAGYERDKESGLDFAQARYYNSQQGRFTSVDPLTASANIKNPQTFNRYSYVLNSPYKFVDPLGLLAESPGRRNEEAWCSICTSIRGGSNSQSEATAGPANGDGDDRTTPHQDTSSGNGSEAGEQQEAVEPETPPNLLEPVESPTQYSGWGANIMRMVPNSTPEDGCTVVTKDGPSCGGSTAVLDYVLIFNAGLQKETQEIYDLSYRIYYTIAVLKHIQQKSGELTKVAITAGGKLVIGGSDKVSGEVEGSVNAELTFISVKERVASLNAFFSSSRYIKFGKKIGKISYLDRTSKSIIPLGEKYGVAQINLINSLASTQATTSANRWIKSWDKGQ